MRYRNTNETGRQWNQLQVRAIWEKARIIAGQDPAVVRSDSCNAPIKWSEYGHQTAFGWEVDHDQPVSLGGSDQLSNLQPLHWRNNQGKSNNWPHWSCSVSAP